MALDIDSMNDSDVYRYLRTFDKYAHDHADQYGGDGAGKREVEIAARIGLLHDVPTFSPTAESLGRLPWDLIPLGSSTNGGSLFWDLTGRHERDDDGVEREDVIVNAPTALIVGPDRKLLAAQISAHMAAHPDDYAVHYASATGDAPDVADEGHAIETSTTLASAVAEARRVADAMNDRYSIMEPLGAVNLDAVPATSLAKTRYGAKQVVLIIDDIEKLVEPMLTARTGNGSEARLASELQSIIGSISRLGRAAHVTLIIVSGNPDAKVLPGELKDNLALRIACGRLTPTASTLVLDSDLATRIPADSRGICALDRYGSEYVFRMYLPRPSRGHSRVTVRQRDAIARWAIEDAYERQYKAHNRRVALAVLAGATAAVAAAAALAVKLLGPRR